MIIRSLSAPPAERVLAVHPAGQQVETRSPRAMRFSVRALLLALLTASVVLSFTACAYDPYLFPQYSFGGRPVPPSLLMHRVMVGVTFNGTSGGLQILDGLRDIRNNIQNTVPGFSISGFSGGYPSQILNFPEQLTGYVYSNSAPFSLTTVNYGSESSSGTAGSFGGQANSLSVTPDFIRIVAAVEQTGQLIVIDQQLGISFGLNLPNVYKVAANRGDTTILAMVRNSNTLYRVVKLQQGTLIQPPGATDCEPQILPLYCVVPVPGTFDRPYGAVFSLDGSSAYVLNCGQECGGGGNGGAGISVIPQGSLQIDRIPASLPYANPVTKTIPIPGGVTTAILDGTNLYAAGQQLQADGLYAGRLTVMNLTTLTAGTPVAISDGSHSKLLFGDDNTLWIGSQFCANGERAKLGLNYNCLTRYDLGAGTASIVPAIAPGAGGLPPSVPYPNADNNLVYLGSLTGLCWVQDLHKIYTAYGGQIHVFNTADGTEIDNTNVTVQGTALDVAYMDALTNQAN